MRITSFSHVEGEVGFVGNFMQDFFPENVVREVLRSGTRWRRGKDYDWALLAVKKIE